jgi:hypothetical protein
MEKNEITQFLTETNQKLSSLTIKDQFEILELLQQWFENRKELYK